MLEKSIIGAGGFAREVKAQMQNKQIKFFVDDQFWNTKDELTLPLSEFDPTKFQTIVAIGNPQVRKKIIDSLPKETKYFTFIHHSAQILDNNNIIGKGSIICAGSIITTNVHIGEHSIINLQTTIGHDCRIGNYFTTAPGAKISGNCLIDDFVNIGTNATIKEKIEIKGPTTIGMNAAVTKNINEEGIYVGVPAKKYILKL